MVTLDDPPALRDDAAGAVRAVEAGVEREEADRPRGAAGSIELARERKKRSGIRGGEGGRSGRRDGQVQLTVLLPPLVVHPLL